MALCYASPACFAFWCPESFLPLTIAWCFGVFIHWCLAFVQIVRVGLDGFRRLIFVDLLRWFVGNYLEHWIISSLCNCDDFTDFGLAWNWWWSSNRVFHSWYLLPKNHVSPWWITISIILTRLFHNLLSRFCNFTIWKNRQRLVSRDYFFDIGCDILNKLSIFIFIFSLGNKTVSFDRFIIFGKVSRKSKNILYSSEAIRITFEPLISRNIEIQEFWFGYYWNNL